MSLPTDIHNLFMSSETTYRYINYEQGMDNNESMGVFLDHLNPSEYQLLLDDGTQIFLRCDGFDFDIRVDAGGDGDFFNHKFEITHIPKVLYENDRK